MGTPQTCTMYKKQGNTWNTLASQNISSSLCNAFTHSSAFSYDFRDPVSLRSASAVIFTNQIQRTTKDTPKSHQCLIQKTMEKCQSPLANLWDLWVHTEKKKKKKRGSSLMSINTVTKWVWLLKAAQRTFKREMSRLAVSSGNKFHGFEKQEEKITYWFAHQTLSWIVYGSQRMYTKKKADEFEVITPHQPELVGEASTLWLSHHCAWSILRVSKAFATSIWTVVATDDDFSSTSRVSQLVLQLLVSSLTIVL